MAAASRNRKKAEATTLTIATRAGRVNVAAVATEILNRKTASKYPSEDDRSSSNPVLEPEIELCSQGRKRATTQAATAIPAGSRSALRVSVTHVSTSLSTVWFKRMQSRCDPA
jgi:hypothetical protein